MESSCKFNLSILHVWFKTFGLNHPVCSICKYLMSGSTLLDGITLYIHLISSSCLFQNFWMDGITLYVQIVCSSCLVQNFGWKHPVCSTCLLHAWFNIFRLNHPVCLICQYFMSGSKLLDGITLYIQLVCSSCVVQNFWMESPCIFNLSVLHVWFKIWMESPCTDPSKCINDQTLRSDREFCRTLHRQMSDQIVRQMSDQIVRQMSDQILPGWSESLHSQIVKL